MKRFLIPALLALLMVSTPARADFPDRPVQMMIPFPPGGVVDSVGRRFAEGLADALKQPVVVVNRDGASGIVAMGALAGSTPDGYTLAFSPNGPLTIQPALRKAPYDLASFKPVCQVSIVTYVLVTSPNSPITNLAQLMSRAKAEGVKAAFGGIGTLPHFALVQLARAGNGQFLNVPFRGDPGVTLAVKGGEVDVGVLGVDTALAQGFRIIASFGANRLAFLPDAATAREQGFDVVADSTTGLFAPRGVSDEVADKLATACATVARAPTFTKALDQYKQEPAYLPGPRFGEALAKDASEKRQLIDSSGIRQDQ